MKPGLAALGMGVFALAMPACVLQAQEASATFQPPRTEWGDPDLTGMWPLEVGQTPMQRNPRYGDQAYLTDEEYEAALKAAIELNQGADVEERSDTLGAGSWFERGRVLRQTSLVMEPANGRIPPLTEEGKRRSEASRSSWDNDVFETIFDFNSLDRCITRGLPATMIPFPYNNGVEIFQAPGYVVFNHEMIHETRIIPVFDRPQLPDEMRTWLGDSRGHWEGNTLVVVSTNFNGESPMVIVGPTNQKLMTSDQLKVTEHFTMTGSDTIRYEAWIEDPVILTAPFKMDFPWRRDESYESFEYACHEGNTLIPAYIKATSPRFAAERAAGIAAREAAHRDAGKITPE
ncbi:hypothetical protein GRI89_05095 [Altererythrobacter salegens]|uniref:Uncharacterized protein n=1 Tax=Croceibacterium salegens TaxID=1737568 RepID=A0A6I4SSQ6_9SPHN|nr:hypothetical protein [Croceibacterium salegens]MXO58913.1 hypothetical protein [Croceibacterium salegens]